MDDSRMIKSLINIPLEVAANVAILARTATATKAVIALISYIAPGSARVVVPMEDLAEICGVKPKTLDGAIDAIAHAKFRQNRIEGDIFDKLDCYDVDGVESFVAEFEHMFAYRCCSVPGIVSVRTLEFSAYRTAAAVFLRLRIGSMGNGRPAGVYRLRSDRVEMIVGHSVAPSVAADDFVPRAVNEINRLSHDVYVEDWSTARLNPGPGSKIGRFDVQFRWLHHHKGQFRRREYREVQEPDSPHKSLSKQASALKGYRRPMPPKTPIEPLS
jgi:hypothetical protein